MSVVDTRECVMIPLVKRDDRDPYARWWGYAGKLGDASGGTNTNTVRPKGATATGLWSIDTLTVQDDGGGGGDKQGRLLLNGVTVPHLFQGTSQFLSWAMRLQDMGASVAVRVATLQSVYGMPPWMMHQKGFLAAVNYIGENTNGATQELFASGLLWDLGALTQPGGPRVPHLT